MEELKDLSAARLAYGRAIEIDPSSAEAHNDFGVFLSRSGEVDRAIDELIQAVKLANARAAYHENLGRVYRKKKLWKEAERELAEASRLAPNEIAVWTALGDTRRKLNQAEDAATAYAAAFHIDPGSEEAAAGLAASLVGRGQALRGRVRPAEGPRGAAGVGNALEQSRSHAGSRGVLRRSGDGLPEGARPPARDGDGAGQPRAGRAASGDPEGGGLGPP